MIYVFQSKLNVLKAFLLYLTDSIAVFTIIVMNTVLKYMLEQ